MEKQSMTLACCDKRLNAPLAQERTGFTLRCLGGPVGIFVPVLGGAIRLQVLLGRALLNWGQVTLETHDDCGMLKALMGPMTPEQMDAIQWRILRDAESTIHSWAPDLDITVRHVDNTGALRPERPLAGTLPSIRKAAVKLMAIRAATALQNKMWPERADEAPRLNAARS